MSEFKRSRKKRPLKKLRKRRSKRRSKRKFGTENTESQENKQQQAVVKYVPKKVPKSLSTKALTKQVISKNRELGFFSNFINPIELIKLIIYSDNISENMLKELKPDPNLVLSGTEYIQEKIIKHYKERIINFVDKLTPEQIVLMSEGKYNSELKHTLLYPWWPKTQIPDSKKINGFREYFKLYFLKSIFAKNLIKKIKIFIKSLSPTQLVLLITGQYNLNNAMLNAFLKTSYPTKLENDKVKELTSE